MTLLASIDLSLLSSAFGLQAPALGWTLAALAVAGLTKGLFGIGMPIVAVPLLTLALPLQTAVSLLTLPLVVTNIVQAIRGHEHPVAVARQMSSILTGMLIGVAVGVAALATLPSHIAKRIVGAALVGFVAWMIRSPKAQVSDGAARYLDPVAGLTSGIFGGIGGQSGTIVFAYLLARGFDKTRFVQHASMFVTVSAITIAALMGAAGMMAPRDYAASALATIPVLAGATLGTRLRELVSETNFRWVVITIILASGLQLIFDSR